MKANLFTRTAWLITALLGLLPGTLLAQGTQTVRGQVIDQQSRFPLPGVVVQVLDAQPPITAVTNDQGQYKLANVPLGRQTLKFSFMGYGERVVPNVLVTSGKEMLLNLGLEETVVQGQAVELTGEKAGAKGNAKNEFAFVSARTFNAEETMRYAGSRADPARMAANFAGVSGVNDGRNDIIIRGNSPTALLWRMEGTDIPNPSHFGALGATGGPVGMLNNNVLDRSDFITGAFPAEYGNAVGGVFDLAIRNGNNEKREFLGQIGFNGFELGAEGPLSKGGRGSYLVNYRYSTLGVFKAIGLNFGTGSAVPEYQDLNFKINLPVGKRSVVSLFGIGGLSSIKFRGAEQAKDSSNNLYSNTYQNQDYATRMGTIGLNFMQFYGNSAYGKLTISASGNSVNASSDSLNKERNTVLPKYRDQSLNTRMAIRYVFNKKFSSRFTVNAGAFADRLGFDYNDSARIYHASGPRWRPLKDDQGATFLLQGHVQAQYKFTDQLSANLGLHYQRLTLNGSQAVEPRAALRYQLSPRQSLNLGYGLHSQLQPLAAYYYQTRRPDFSLVRMNTKLDFTRSHHIVLGHQLALTEKTRLKTEVYMQHLFNVPVTTYSSSFSMLNFGADFNYPEFDSLTNKGLGRNLGLELTLERNFNDGYYLLSTLSLFESKYRGSDGVWRSTVFNSGVVFNLLGGKEWKLNSRSVLALDLKQTISGGRRYTPVNVEESRRSGRAIYQDDKAYSQISMPYLRTDAKITWRINGARATQEIFLDVQNIFNRQNVYAIYWDPAVNRQVTVPQLGLFPVPGYRLTF